MGEIADMYHDGSLCKKCGCPVDADLADETGLLPMPPGHPRICAECEGEPARKEERRKAAADQFDEAFAICATVPGLRLIKHTGQHYQIRFYGREPWILNVYPGNGRIWADRKQQNPPFLKLPDPWTLVDVAKAAKCAAIEQIESC